MNRAGSSLTRYVAGSWLLRGKLRNREDCLGSFGLVGRTFYDCPLRRSAHAQRGPCDNFPNDGVHDDVIRAMFCTLAGSVERLANFGMSSRKQRLHIENAPDLHQYRSGKCVFEPSLSDLLWWAGHDLL